MDYKGVLYTCTGGQREKNLEYKDLVFVRYIADFITIFYLFINLEFVQLGERN